MLPKEILGKNARKKEQQAWIQRLKELSSLFEALMFAGARKSGGCFCLALRESGSQQHLTFFSSEGSEENAGIRPRDVPLIEERKKKRQRKRFIFEQRDGRGKRIFVAKLPESSAKKKPHLRRK